MILNKMQKGRKKGVSPVVATILLITIAIILALIIFFWIRSLIGESVVKFEQQNTEMLCGRLNFDATYDYSSEELSLFNSGDVPIYDFEIFIKKTGGHTTTNLKEVFSGTSETPWPVTGLRSGETFWGVMKLDGLASVNEIVIIPILRGRGVNSGQMKTVACKQSVGIRVSKK